MRNNKLLFLILGLFLLALILILAFLAWPKKPIIKLSPDYQLSTKRIVQKKKLYLSSRAFPQMKSPKYRQLARKFNKIMKESALLGWPEFIDQLQYADQTLPVQAQNSFFSTFEVVSAEHNLVSVRFDRSIYFKGQAHPINNVVVINVDLYSGEVVKITDIFQSGTGWLSFLSQYCIEELKKRFDGGGWPDDGADPAASNFKNFYFTKDGLTIVFDQLQVAAYAEGFPEVIIPYDKLTNYLQPRHLKN